MKYDVLKDVIIDGVAIEKGKSVEISHDKTDRLVMLGYIAPAKAATKKKRQIKTVKAQSQEG